MKILAIHDGHNASAAYLADGKVIAAIQEERLSRYKNHGGFPEMAVREVLKLGNCKFDELDLAVFSGLGVTNLKMKKDVMASYERKFNGRRRSFFQRMEKKTRDIRKFVYSNDGSKRKESRRRKKRTLRKEPLLKLGVDPNKIRFMDHHLCHAAASYFGQGDMQEDILVVTCDGAGDHISASVRIGRKGRMKKIAEVSEDDSIPILYSLITYMLGFVPLEHEYKLMGLAPYAEGAGQSHEIRDYFKQLFQFTEDRPLGWTRAAGIDSIFKLGPVLKNRLEFSRFDQIASGLQSFIEDFILEWMGRVIRETDIHRLALSGGLFMNVKLNKRIMEMDEVESVYVLPSCGDESNCIGAGLAAYAEFNGQVPDNIPPLKAVYFGTDFTKNDMAQNIDGFQFKKTVEIVRFDDIERKCAELIADGQIVARYKGAMEFGARALGNRSILADPESWHTIYRINAMIKQRDFWMPFAPSMLAEYADEYIVNPKGIHSPYMILSFDTRKEKLNNIIAATHPYDGTCRPQVVEKSWNPDYYRLIDHYRKLTGKAVVLNTSFNLHGYPIVYTPEDALEVFDKSGLQYLALGQYLVKEAQS